MWALECLCREPGTAALAEQCQSPQLSALFSPLWTKSYFKSAAEPAPRRGEGQGGHLQPFQEAFSGGPKQAEPSQGSCSALWQGAALQPGTAPPAAPSPSTQQGRAQGQCQLLPRGAQGSPTAGLTLAGLSRGLHMSCIAGTQLGGDTRSPPAQAQGDAASDQAAQDLARDLLAPQGCPLGSPRHCLLLPPSAGSTNPPSSHHPPLVHCLRSPGQGAGAAGLEGTGTWAQQLPTSASGLSASVAATSIDVTSMAATSSSMAVPSLMWPVAPLCAQSALPGARALWIQVAARALQDVTC